MWLNFNFTVETKPNILNLKLTSRSMILYLKIFSSSNHLKLFVFRWYPSDYRYNLHHKRVVIISNYYYLGGDPVNTDITYTTSG